MTPDTTSTTAPAPKAPPAAAATTAVPPPQTGQVWINGDLVPAAQAQVSVFDHGLLYGDGVFEGIRIYGGRVLKLDTHLRRLDASARAIRLSIPYAHEALAEAVRSTCRANDVADGYVRLVVTRGVGPLGINPFQCQAPRVIVIAARLKLFPASLYEQGVRVVFSSYLRNHPQALSPRIKSLNYLNNVLAKAEAIEAGADEAILFNHLGHVAEGGAENLFLVRHGSGASELLTPSLECGPLAGVTRGIVLELAERMGLPTRETVLTRFDIQTADEAFFTGTGAEIVPVVNAGGAVIGAGVPGPVTRRVIHAFREYVAEAPED